MGDIADYLIASEEIWWFPSEPNHSPSANKVITCTYCGKKGLKWKQVNDKWRLFEKDEPHKCDEYFKAKLEEKKGAE